MCIRDSLYPLQNDVLRLLAGLETGFYLTGGTAASRGYLHHRYSDDLDFFVNDDARFSAWTDQILNTLAEEASWEVTVRLRGARFVGLTVLRDQTELRIDLVNDVRARVEDMDLGGILASLCFPSFPRFCGQIFMNGTDRELARLCVEAYNDWMVEEWCAGSGGRLIPLCIVPLWDPILAAAEIRTALHFMRPPHPDWTVPVQCVSAATGEGLDDLWSELVRHRTTMSANGAFADRRQQQQLRWMWSLVEDSLREGLRHREGRREPPGVYPA